MAVVVVAVDKAVYRKQPGVVVVQKEDRSFGEAEGQDKADGRSWSSSISINQSINQRK